MANPALSDRLLLCYSQRGIFIERIHEIDQFNIIQFVNSWQIKIGYEKHVLPQKSIKLICLFTFIYTGYLVETIGLILMRDQRFTCIGQSILDHRVVWSCSRDA